MRITMKKILAAVFFMMLGLLQINVLFPARPVEAYDSLLSSQQGFKDGEIKTAFGNETDEDIRITVVKIIKVILSILALLFVVLLVLAGYKYMTAAGNEDQVKSATKIIVQAIIGLVIVLSAWGISHFVLLQLIEGTGAQAVIKN